jgi:hypothetical protein
MDGTNCRSPIGGGFGIWTQTWESNRAVRMENLGDSDVIQSLALQRTQQLRSLKEIVAGVVRPA